MAPTVEKHEKKKSGIRRLLSPVIFSSGGHSNADSRNDSFYQRRKTEPGASSTSPSSSSSPSSPTKPRKNHSKPSVIRFGRANKNAVGSSVETAFVGTAPAARTPEAAPAAEKDYQRTSYGAPPGLIQRYYTLGCNDDELRNPPTATKAPVYCSADVRSGTGTDDCSLRSAQTASDTESIADSGRGERSAYTTAHYARATPEDRYPPTEYRDGRSSAPPTPYSQYYNRASAASSPAQSPTSFDGSPAPPHKVSPGASNEYPVTRQWTTVVNERNEALATRCKTILRPQPLYSVAPSVPVAKVTNRQSPSDVGYGYARVTKAPKSAIAQAVPVAMQQPHASLRRKPSNADDAPIKGPLYVSNTPADTHYESVAATASGAVAGSSAPIFKRGTLRSSPALPVPAKQKPAGAAVANTSPKKVTFPSSTASTAVYWPTRRGMTVDPPCRQSHEGAGASPVVDVEAAYADVYAGASDTRNAGGSGDAGANFVRASPSATGASRIPVADSSLSPPAAGATKAAHQPQNLPPFRRPAKGSDYADYAALTALLPPRVGNSTAARGQHLAEGRYPQPKQLQPRHRPEQYAHSRSGSQPTLHDRRLYQYHSPQMRQSHSKAPRFEECEYQSLQPPSESESGSEAGEIRKILRSNGDNGRDKVDQEMQRGFAYRRSDLHRHTLSGPQRSAAKAAAFYNSRGSVAVENNLYLKSPSSCNYPPLANSTMFDDDPGIMSEVETSSTGFRRGTKQRSSLPVVRTMSKTMESPLGLVFLQFRNETKRALLPNEITSLDTVRALFVRSFPKQLTMAYLGSPRVKIYIHDSNKDMFYELEDHRSHLNEIRNHSLLRLFELIDGDKPVPPGLPGAIQTSNDIDQSYFSEPEFDSEFQHQHVHKSKSQLAKSNLAYQPNYAFPAGALATLPRSGPSMRPFSPMLPINTDIFLKSAHAGFATSPERGLALPQGYSLQTRNYSDDSFYSQYSSRASSVTPVMDKETSNIERLKDDNGYELYSNVKLPVTTVAEATTNRELNFASSTPVTSPPSDTTRLRVEHMERQLANLTGLVQKALTQTLPSASPTDPHSSSPSENEKQKPVPPPKPSNVSPAANTYDGRTLYRDLQLTPEMYNQLRSLQKKATDLHHELRNLRRISQAETHSIKESVRDAFVKIRSMVLSGGESLWSGGADSERIRVTREEEIYKEDINRLEEDLTELESTVEKQRSNVINCKTRVSMIDVENMALILSRSSKTVADLKQKFPLLQAAIKSVMSLEMQRVISEENFLEEEPKRLESALRRCKKLTGTLVTLRRLASVQEQRLPDNCVSPVVDDVPTSISKKNDTNGNATPCAKATSSVSAKCNAYITNTFPSRLEESPKMEGDSYSRGNGPGGLAHRNNTAGNTFMVRSSRPLPSPSDTKPPVPEHLGDYAARRIPPPPPLRTSSKSPLASPTCQTSFTSLYSLAPLASSHATNNHKASANLQSLLIVDDNTRPLLSPSTSSSGESVNSQEGSQHQALYRHHEQLEIRHQELLEKQRALQEQYSRLQQFQRTPPPQITSEETPPTSGSALAANSHMNFSFDFVNSEANNKVYETDIL